jgi:hypothetical protein
MGHTQNVFCYDVCRCACTICEHVNMPGKVTVQIIITSCYSRREGKQPGAERVGTEIAHLIARAIHDKLPPEVHKLVAHFATRLVVHVIVTDLFIGALPHNLQHRKQQNQRHNGGDELGHGKLSKRGRTT